MTAGLFIILGRLMAFSAVRGDSAAEAKGDSANDWIPVVLNCSSVVCFAFWWRWMNRQRREEKRHADSLAIATLEPGDDAAWKARALAAEERAAKATALLKARLMPQLARWMMGELLQKLMHQRSHLLTSQQKAEEEVEELEQRLEKLHAPLEERLRAYERRISELEKELAAKGDENRQLIEAKIDTARKRLETERSKNPVSWN
jgi:DNA repair exonuclease SbcCD ATPase subunit